MKLFRIILTIALAAPAAEAGGLESLAAAPFALPAADGIAVPPAGDASPAGGEDLAALRAEAAADPARFIDERTPEEVSLAFGLPSGEEGHGETKQLMNSSLARLARVRITVDLSSQRLTLASPELDASFVISSGLPPKNTTPGSGKCFKPDFLRKMHYSSLYNNAPMPHSVFFNGNIAIHGTLAEDKLGAPASKGCIRTSLADAEAIYGIVKAHGKENTSICVTGRTPAN